MIGLKRGTVKLVPHQASWARYFRKEAEAIRDRLGPTVVDVQHIGSTAIPGIHAKPIIDMLLGVKKLRGVKKHFVQLKPLGYVYRPVPRNSHRKLLYVKGPAHHRLVYLHVVRYNGSVWRKDISFRDQLIGNRRLARQYERIKQRLAKKHPDDRGKYTAGKLPFIFSVQSRRLSRR